MAADWLTLSHEAEGRNRSRVELWAILNSFQTLNSSKRTGRGRGIVLIGSTSLTSMIGAKRKAESGLLATEDLVQQALREVEAQKAAKKQQKDPTGDLGKVLF